MGAPAIWVDVEDIFEYFRFNPHPSGVQRVAIEITRALIAEAGSRVRVVRHGAQPGRVREVRWAELETMLATPPAPEQPQAEREPEDDAQRRSRVQRSILRLPPELRDLSGDNYDERSASTRMSGRGGGFGRG